MFFRNIIQAVTLFLFGIALLLPLQGVRAEEIQPEAAGHHHAEADPEKLSEEEKEWFETFQEGTFYTRGWKDITAQILEKSPQIVREELHQALESLGKRIGCEWSKNNATRRISTEMLKQWGDFLEQTAEDKPDMISQAIAHINQKVTSLLSK